MVRSRVGCLGAMPGNKATVNFINNHPEPRGTCCRNALHRPAGGGGRARRDAGSAICAVRVRAVPGSIVVYGGSGSGNGARTKGGKDPNKPKGPLSAYILFGQDVRPKIKEKFPNLKQTEVMSKIGVLWKEIDEDEKDEYTARAKVSKDEYDAKMKVYAASSGSSSTKARGGGRGGGGGGAKHP